MGILEKWKSNGWMKRSASPLVETSTKKRLSPTVYYLLAGLICSWPGFFLTGHLLPMWKVGVAFAPASLATIHILVLGAMLTIAYGVLYQIIPIAFQAPPLPRHLLYWHLPAHLLSVTAMVMGFLLSEFQIVGMGGTLLLLTSVVYFSYVMRSYAKARNKTTVHKGLTIPFIALLCVLLIGLYQAYFPAKVSQSILKSHVLIGGLAFWGGLVVVFSYKLLPMFAISHGYKVSLPRTATLYFVGIVSLLCSAWAGNAHFHMWLNEIGCTLVSFALLFYAVDMVAIVRARKRRRLVLPLYDAFLAMFGIVCGQLWMMFAIVFDKTTWLYPAAYLFAFGGLIPLMFAFMQKIVPFLWFEYRFSKRPERKTAPLIDEMVSPRIAQFGMGTFFVGVLLGLTALLFNRDTPPWSFVDWTSAACLTIGSMLLFFALRRVLTIGGVRPLDEPAAPGPTRNPPV